MTLFPVLLLFFLWATQWKFPPLSCLVSSQINIVQVLCKKLGFRVPVALSFCLSIHISVSHFSLPFRLCLSLYCCLCLSVRYLAWHLSCKILSCFIDVHISLRIGFKNMHEAFYISTHFYHMLQKGFSQNISVATVTVSSRLLTKVSLDISEFDANV